MTEVDRVTAWEERQRARLEWAEREVERAYREQIASRNWADRCWKRAGDLEEQMQRLKRLYDISDEDEVLHARLVIARNDARIAWIRAVRADFRRKRADNRLRRALLVRDESSFNLGGRG